MRGAELQGFSWFCHGTAGFQLVLSQVHSDTPRYLTCMWKPSKLCAWSPWSWHLTMYAHVSQTLRLICFLSAVSITPAVHRGSVNRSASPQKREVLLLNGVGTLRQPKVRLFAPLVIEFDPWSPNLIHGTLSWIELIITISWMELVIIGFKLSRNE